VVGNNRRRCPQGFIDMDIALRDALRSVAKKLCNGEFGVAKASRNTRKTMAKHVRGDISRTWLGAAAES
jgi:hypothetical protein